MMELSIHLLTLLIWIMRANCQIAPVPDCAEIPGINKDIVIPWTYTATGALVGIDWIGNAGSDFNILIYTGTYSYGPGYDAMKVEHVQNGEAWLKVMNFQTSDAFEYRVIVTADDILSDQVTISHTDLSELDDIHLSCDDTPLGPSDVIPESCSIFAVAIPTTWVYNFIVSYDNGHIDGPVHKERANCPGNICSFNGENQGSPNVFVNASLILCSGQMRKTFIQQYGVAPGPPVITGVPADSVIEGDSLSGVTCSLPNGEEGSPDTGYVYHWTNTESSLMINSTDDELTIDPLNITLHDGTWECRVRNAAGTGPPGSFSLTVHAAPVIWSNPPPTVSLIINETLSAACSFRGRPEVTITWTYNSNTLPAGIQSNNSTSPSGKYTVTTSTLSWSQATDTQKKAASGLYRCEASNTAGSETSTQMILTALFAPGKPAVTGVPTDPVIEGNSLSGVTCSLPSGEEGSPDTGYTYLWTNTDNSLVITSTNGQLTIDPINVTQHDGTWECRVQNSVGTSSPGPFSLTVHAAPVLWSNPPPAVSLIINETLSTACSFRGRPEVTITWTYNSNTLPAGIQSDSSTSPSGKYTVTTSILSWSQATDTQRKAASGLYRCEASNTAGSETSTQMNLTALYAPGQAAATDPSIGQVFEGTSVDLECSVSDTGSPRWHQFRWMKDGSFVDTSTTGTYTILSLTVTDHDGIWTCTAVNTIGQGHPANINLTVYALPVLQSPFPTLTTPVAENIMSLDILCSIQGRPPPAVMWDNNNLPPGVKSEEEPDTTAGKLTTVNRRLKWVNDSTLEQRRLTGKNYTCKGQILNEADEGTVKVNVQFGPYDIAISPSENQTVVENDTVTLTCGANCNPGCNYTWSYEGGRKLKSTHLRKFHNDRRQTGGELHLESIGRDNHGWFTCGANNNIGSNTQQNVYISVNYPPDIFITIIPSEVMHRECTIGDVVQGQDVTVLCSVDSRPPDNTITWTNVTGGHPPHYDDKYNSTHSWITITDIDILDTGELRCTADNGVSVSPRSQQIYMEVFGPARVNDTYPLNNRTGAGVGDHVSFQLSIIARPIPSQGNWSWMFVPENLTVDAEISVPGGVDLIISSDLASLNILNVTTEHFGNYSIHTSNCYGGWDTGDVVFELFASGPPSRPTGFQAVRVTAVSITVEWMTGFDGGLPQTFTITYTNRDSGDEGEMSDIPDDCPSEGCIMQRKITEGIADDTEYELQIRADNGKGQAMGDKMTVYTPVQASLPQPAIISLGDTDAEITFSVIGQLTDVIIHHCVKDTENCKDDKFPILTPQQDNQGRGRRQARDTTHNFAQTVNLVDPSASSFAFEVLLYDGDDKIHNAEVIAIDRKGVNVAAIVGGVIGGLLLAGLVIALVLLWRKGIIPINAGKKEGKARRQLSDHGDQQMVPRNKAGFSNLGFQKEVDAESIYEDTESSGILVSNFPAYVYNILKSPKPFEDEYDEDLPQGKQFDWNDASRHDDLKLKNRFRNILPYDRNRVYLKTLPDDPYSDYINASYIKGYTDDDKMIATIGPMPATIDDFWRMVWEKESPLIVMLTNCIEVGKKRKCEQYWPISTEGQPLNYGDIQITMPKEDIWPDYTVRTLSVTKNGLKRIVSHCHFTAWPDHGVPDCGTSLIAFRGIVAKKMIPGRYTVVHCSAGVGRTGTLIALDYLIKQAERENKVDVFSCVEELRMQRIAMVQSSMQYVFIYTTLAEYFTTGPTAILCSDFNKYYLKISKPKRTGPSTMENQMKMMNKLTPKISDADKDYPLGGVNSFKNRTPEIIPLLSSRVFLPSRMPGRNDYINAVYVNACRRKDAFIVTQVPLASTIIDFWRLIEDFNSSTVVLLVTDQQYKTMPLFVPSTDNPCVVSNNKMARLTSSIDNFGYTTVKADIGPVPAEENAYMNFEDVSKPVAPTFEPTSTMKIFIMHIPENKKCPDAKQTINIINDMKTWVSENQPHPITVACWDGAAYSGQFVACCNLMEMMSYEPEVDVYRIVKQIRDRRPQFINNLDQYHGLHHFVLQYLQEFSLYANVI